VFVCVYYAYTSRGIQQTKKNGVVVVAGQRRVLPAASGKPRDGRNLNKNTVNNNRIMRARRQPVRPYCMRAVLETSILNINRLYILYSVYENIYVYCICIIVIIIDKYNEIMIIIIKKFRFHTNARNGINGRVLSVLKARLLLLIFFILLF